MQLWSCLVFLYLFVLFSSLLLPSSFISENSIRLSFCFVVCVLTQYITLYLFCFFFRDKKHFKNFCLKYLFCLTLYSILYTLNSILCTLYFDLSICLSISITLRILTFEYTNIRITYCDIEFYLMYEISNESYVCLFI